MPVLLLLIALFIETNDHSNIAKVINRMGNWYSVINEAKAVVIPTPTILDIEERVTNRKDEEQLLYPVENIANSGDT